MKMESDAMRSALRVLSALMIASAIASPAVVAGCYHHHDDHYDNRDSGRWSDSEGPYYARWEQETHRDHKEWSNRNGDEQREYWSWRQQHQQ